MVDNETLELKQEFLSEANELLSTMEEQVLELENNKESLDSINSIFRVAHTLKGGAAALELERIAVFTHNLENLLDLVRDEKLSVDEEVIDIILKSLDILNALVKAASSNTEAPVGIETDTLANIKAKSSGGVQQPVVSEHSPATVQPTSPEVSDAHPVHTSIPTIDSSSDDDSFKEILMDEFELGEVELAQIKSEMISSAHLFLIHVHLDDTNEMKSVSGIQTITAIKGLGTLISAAPSIAEIMEVEFIEHLQFLLLSRENQERVFGKIYLSDVTKEVEVSDISTMFGKVKEEKRVKLDSIFDQGMNPLDQVPEQNFLSFKDAVTSALSSGNKVYNVRALINEDAPMRDVDSLLVITALEEIGNVISSVPTKRELQDDVYYPVVDVLMESARSKEEVKEKAFVQGATLEIRISEFYLKDQEILNTANKKISDMSTSQLSVGASVTPVPKAVIEEAQAPIRQGDVIKPLETQSSVAFNKENQEATPNILERAETRSFSDRLMSKEEMRIRGLKTADNDSTVMQKTFLKVDSARMDHLMNLVSELVIGKAALGQMTSMVLTSTNDLRIRVSDMLAMITEISVKHPNVERDSLRKLYQFLETAQQMWDNGDFFDATVNRVSRSINELQEGITKIRMVPIGNVFNRLPRMIRDISKQLGKKIRLEISGEDTELDKTVIEELADPLMHMVRNSADHGIEMPDIRRAKGKPEEGTVYLRAIHEGTMIRIEIEDNGAGLDPNRLFNKAVEKGLVSSSSNLSIEEINQLILLPGFSTAEQVTDLSGRGVGMDVVRRNIEELSGKLKIESEFGKGSKFIIKIPLTLSIVQALVFKVKGFFYAVPLSVISETIPLRADDIKIFESSDVINMNEQLISVINIAKIFHLKESREERQDLYLEHENSNASTQLLDESLKILERIRLRESGAEQDYFSIHEADRNNEQEDIITHKYLIVVQTGAKKVGFLVDNIISEQDIVIKPLDKRYSATQGLSGATILGDGSISLVLDVVQIVDLYLNKDNKVVL